jgi:hypothetical protein
LDNWQAQWHELAERELFRLRPAPMEPAAAQLPGKSGKIQLEAAPGKLQQRFWRERK